MIKTYLVRCILLTSVVCSTVYGQLQWQKGGNNILGGPPTIGTDGTWNAPLDFLTLGNPRMHINEQLNFSTPYLGAGGVYLGWLNANYGGTYGPMGVGFKPEGYIGINTSTPRTRLHIAGPTTAGPGTGWRPWMSTGVYMNEQSNNMYVGMYKKGDNSASDAMVNWGDDGVGGLSPTNRLRINFTPSIGLLPGTPPIYDRDMEMMSYWANRRVGIGDFINFTNGPQRHLHIHNAFGGSDFIQITNTATIGGNLPPQNSGFHLGNANATASLIQYENNHIIAYTNIAGAAIGERMRITHIGAPGVNNPGGLATNQTKIGISLDPTAPVTSPLSLLHLGYNTAGAMDGWRPWMANGMFVSQASDNVFIGLKQENYLIPTINRFDAVINWGDDMIGAPPIAGLGPDNLRFIFTSFATSGDAASGTDGLEVARFSPNCANCPLNRPSFGIGNFAPSGPQGPGTPDYIDATLDVDGDANIREVMQNDNLNQVLVRDPLDHGKIYWRDANTITPGGSGGTITANNGLHMQTPTEVHLGGTLLYNTEIEQNGFILDLRNGGIQRQIFYPNGAVYQNTDNTAGYAHRMDVASDEGLFIVQTSSGTNIRSIQAVYDQLNSSASFVGERLGTTSYGFRSLMHSDNVNYGLHAVVQGTLATDNTAVFAAAGNASNTNTGVYCSAPIGTGNNAIIINGEGLQVAGGNNFSDSIIKTNVQPITNATQIIEQLHPKTFEFRYNDFPSINFDHDSHFGVIAQDVEDVLPTLVGSGTIPAVLDSNNNVIHPAQTIKTVVYEEFIPILIAGFNEQQQRINQQDSTIAAMQQQMNDMMAMITNCCAQGNNLQAPSNNNPQTINYQPNVHQRDVKLTDTYCVLGESSPNPFRDHTVINYELAETIQSAQIVFYNMVGQIIKVIEINERGLGRLNVYGEDLRSGMYSYSLIIDGNVCESKKMIKE